MRPKDDKLTDARQTEHKGRKKKIGQVITCKDCKKCKRMTSYM
jgi:hypothetical protein